MVKRITALVIAIAFIASLAPTLAVAQAEGESNRGKSIFQIVADTMPEKVALAERNQPKKIQTVNIFQNWANYIKEGSAKAKGMSLRAK